MAHGAALALPSRPALGHLDVQGPVPLHLQECFPHLKYQVGALPHAEAAAAHTLALPMYPELTEQQQARVVRVIADHVKSA